MRLIDRITLYEQARQFRKNPTSAERLLWQRLRAKKLNGLKFRRQHPLGPFIVDFYCFERKLIIEVDGDIHQTQLEYDQERSRYFEVRDLKVVRISNKMIETDIEAAVNMITSML